MESNLNLLRLQRENKKVSGLVHTVLMKTALKREPK